MRMKIKFEKENLEMTLFLGLKSCKQH